MLRTVMFESTIFSRTVLCERSGFFVSCTDTVMENKYYKYYTEDIKELKLDQLEDPAGGASNEVKCPIC